MSHKIFLSIFTFVVLILLGCAKEKDQQLLNIIDSFQLIFNNLELKNIKHLNKDSLYEGNFETYKKYLMLFDENNEKLESTIYFESKGISSGPGFKFDFLIIALHFKLNGKFDFLNFSYLRKNVLYRSEQLNKARFKN